MSEGSKPVWGRTYLIPLLVGLTGGGIGWAANSAVQFQVLSASFERHEKTHGHEGITRDMQDMTRSVAELAIQMKHLAEKQKETTATVKELQQEQREDMKEVRRALRIPERPVR